MSLTFPTINLNGTSKEALLEELFAVYVHLKGTIELLSRAAPHGRDYQTQSPGAYQKAREEHLDRLRRLEGVEAELEAICRNIQEQSR